MTDNSAVDPVYILIRTSGRPRFFEKMMESIKEQTYKNIITIVHSDDPADEYVTGDIILNSEKLNGPNMGSAPYNLYCNTLLKAIPEETQGTGWFHFMDDDDVYAAPDAIERFVMHSRPDAVNIARSDRGQGNIWPKYWKGQHSFQTQCFLIHTEHRLKATWWDKKAGDHHYSGQLTKILKENWIDGLIIARAQEGKGRGERYDLGQAPRNAMQEMTAIVYYLERVKSPSIVRADKGEIKTIPRKMAEKLFEKNYVKIIDKVEFYDFVANIKSK